MNAFEFWPDSEDQAEWMTNTITDASATFQILPRDAVLYAFKLLASETTLTKKAQEQIRQKIANATGKRP